MCPTSHLESESQKRANQLSRATRENALKSNNKLPIHPINLSLNESSFRCLIWRSMQANMILSEQYLPCTTLHALPYADDTATSLPQRHTPPIDAKF
ncbi:hypothetical protein IG631_09605 [Alternaria alternata]|nr:hypothetical protein IG631_09605 [Alternaria alternata]